MAKKTGDRNKESGARSQEGEVRALSVDKLDEGTFVAVPQFTLRADRAGHLGALIHASMLRALMPAEDAAEIDVAIREFELWMDGQRG